MISKQTLPPVYRNSSNSFSTSTQTTKSNFYHSHKQIIYSVSMRRESCEPTMMHSSIALLQERFRQLERAKEMRQQKELLRLFSDVEPVRTPAAYESPSKYVHSELMLPPAQHVQGTLYAQASMQSMQTDLQVNETPEFSNLRPTDTVIHIRNDFDESDVDTSLHL